jgi:hypothetical protein
MLLSLVLHYNVANDTSNRQMVFRHHNCSSDSNNSDNGS